jgi:uncharacterized YigZ family protein
MESTDEVRTLTRPHRVEIEKVRGSRFVADAAPVADEAAALAVVADVQSAFPDASHHCWAYRLEGGRERADDDGEPRGTAGAPILRHLQGADLSDVVVVVTRWFGGTLLGRGGLVRAYGGAAAAVLSAAPVAVRPVTVVLACDHDYDLSGAVDAVLAAHAARVVAADYGVAVTRRVAVPRAAVDDLVADMAEATAGRVFPRPA